ITLYDTVYLHDALPIFLNKLKIDECSISVVIKWFPSFFTLFNNVIIANLFDSVPPLVKNTSSNSACKLLANTVRASFKASLALRSEEHTSELQSRFDLV